MRVASLFGSSSDLGRQIGAAEEPRPRAGSVLLVYGVAPAAPIAAAALPVTAGYVGLALTIAVAAAAVVLVVSAGRASLAARCDVLGAAATGSAAVCTLGAALLLLDTGWSWEAASCCITGFVGLVVVIWGAKRAGLRLSELTEVWTRPIADRGMASFGALIALPYLVIHGPVLWEADSARLVASTRYVQQHGPRFLIDTQEVLLPHLTIGPMVWLSGISGSNLLAAATLLALAAVVSFITWKLSRSLLGVIVSVLLLLSMPAVVSQAGTLPLYLPMLAFGYLSMWLAHRAMHLQGRALLTMAMAAAGCLVLSLEAHGVGQLFLAGPLIVWLMRPTQQRLRALVAVVLATGLLMMPRVVINLAVGGLHRFRTNRDDYFIVNGYLERINEQLWGYPVSEGSLSYLTHFPGQLREALGWSWWLALALVLIAFVRAGATGRLLGLLALGGFGLALALATPPPFTRYLSPLLPGIAIGAGIGSVALARVRHVGGLLAAAAVLVALSLAGRELSQRHDLVSERQERVMASPIAELAPQLPGGSRVLGTRSHQLLWIRPDIETYGSMFLEEEEYVDYLTWPSDSVVVEMMRRRQIEWVLVLPDHQLEIDYHGVWLVPEHGEQARHVERIAESSAFCIASEVEGYRLYRLGSCAEA